MWEKFNEIGTLVEEEDSEYKKPRKKNDELLKSAFEEHFVDFLRFVYPDADDVLDLSKAPQFMDKELFAIAPDRERKNDKREADLLAKLYLKNGTEKWIFLNVEIEGQNDPELSERLYQYYYRIRERYNVSVATIAVFIGDENQSRPNHYREELLGTVLSFKYTTYHVFDHSQEVLLANPNPFALVVLACQKALLEGKIYDEELNEERLRLARALISRGYDRNKIISFTAFLKNIMFIKDKTINSLFDRQIIKLTGGEIKMGIIETIKMQERREGREEGYAKALQERTQALQQKNHDVVKNLILELGLPDEQISKIAAVSIAFVKKIRAELNAKTEPH